MSDDDDARNQVNAAQNRKGAATSLGVTYTYRTDASILSATTPVASTTFAYGSFEHGSDHL